MNEIFIERHHLPHLLTVGEFKVLEPWIHNERQLNINTMLIVVEGELLICEDGIDYSVTKGHVFTFKSGCKQWGKRQIKPGAKWFWCSFLPLQINVKGQVIQLPKVIKLDDLPGVHEHILRMKAIYDDHKPFYNELLNSMLYELFFKLLLCDRSNEEKESESISNQVIRIISRDLRSSFSSEKISKELGLNYSYIGRRFKKESGKTIVEVYQELKIRKAIEFLVQDGLSVTQTSERLGYPNPYYFSRMFKKTTGLSPSIYLKQMYPFSGADN